MHERTAARPVALNWPEAYADILPVLQRDWEVDGEIYLSRKLSGGKSGALVFAVDISCRSFTGQAILKLEEAFDPGAQELYEASLHEQAIKDAPEYAAKHLPRILHSLHHGKQFAILSTIAGRGLEYAETWVDCSFDRKLKAVHDVSSGLLEDWNADYRLTQGLRMPHELLQSWLAYRLDPAQGGRIHEFVCGTCGIPADAPTFIYDGRWYPNPLAFALGLSGQQNPVQMRGAVGHCHCDFHGLNLLVGRQESPGPNYYMIDLAMYESEQFLFYDHAYFELAGLLFARGNSTISEWQSVVAQLSRYSSDEERPDLRTDDIGLIELMRAMRAGVSNWIERHEADRLSFMENQSILARVAVGLNFTHKHMSGESRQMAFLYAAADLNDYLKLNNIKWAKTGPILQCGLAATVPPDASAQPDSSVVAAAETTLPDEPVPTATGTHDIGTSEPNRTHGLSSRVANVFSELHLRKVIRVVGIYAVTAWLLVQLLDAVEARFNLPDWSSQFVLGLAALGLPIIGIAAWARAHRRAASKGRGSASAPRNRGYFAAIVDYGLLLSLVTIVALGAWKICPDYNCEAGLGGSPSLSSTDDPQPATGQKTQPSLAVLPFKNLSSNGDDSFTDGLSIDIASVFAETGLFRMPGMSSAFRFKGRLSNVRAIGQALNVEYLLEGTVLRSGDNLTVTASLIRAKDRFLIWSDTFKETMGKVFVIQQKIAEAIASRIAAPIDIDADVLKERRTDDPRAYELFVRGLALLELRGAALRDAMRVLKRAVAIHPDFAAAWGALSLVYDVIPTFVKEIDGRPVNAAVYYRKAKEAALEARRIDPDLPLVQHAVGRMYQRDRQWAAAEEAYKAALQGDPTAHRVMLSYGALLFTVGRQSESRNVVDEAKEADPLNGLYDLWAAFLRWQGDQSEQTIAPIESIFRRIRQYREIALRMIIDHRARTGELDKVRDLLKSCRECSQELQAKGLAILDAASAEPPNKLFEAYKDSNILGYQLLYAVGGADVTLDSFRYYGVDANRRLLFFTVPWTLASVLSQNQRFSDIADDMGLVSYWNLHGWPDHCKPGTDSQFTCN